MRVLLLALSSHTRIEKLELGSWENCDMTSMLNLLLVFFSQSREHFSSLIEIDLGLQRTLDEDVSAVVECFHQTIVRTGRPVNLRILRVKDMVLPL